MPPVTAWISILCLALVTAAYPSTATRAQGRVELPPHRVTTPAGHISDGGCTGAEDISQSWTNNATALNTADNPAIGQSLTAPCSGSLEAVSFSVAGVVTPGSLRLEVYQGPGDTGALLSATTVNVQTTGAHTVALPQPVAVTDGVFYTFKLTIPEGQSTSTTIADWWGGGNGERYPDGTEYNVAFGGGGTHFGPDPEYDLTFGADFEPAEPVGCDVFQPLSDGAVDLNTAFNTALGQSFVSPCDGFVRSVSFWVWTVDEPGPLTLALHQGSGDAGAVVATGGIQVDTVGLHRVTFASPVAVATSATYTFKLTVPGGHATSVDLEEHAQNPYPGGMEFNVAYAGGGSSFAGDPAYDLAFTVDIDLASSTEPQGETAEHALQLDVRPNPVAAGAVLTVRTGDTGNVLVSVFDALGRHVATLHDGPLAAGVHHLPLAVDRLVPGVYVVRATSGGAVAATRVVVGGER